MKWISEENPRLNSVSIVEELTSNISPNASAILCRGSTFQSEISHHPVGVLWLLKNPATTLLLLGIRPGVNQR